MCNCWLHQCDTHISFALCELVSGAKHAGETAAPEDKTTAELHIVTVLSWGKLKCSYSFKRERVEEVTQELNQMDNYKQACHTFSNDTSHCVLWGLRAWS